MKPQDQGQAEQKTKCSNNVKAVIRQEKRCSQSIQVKTQHTPLVALYKQPRNDK